MNSDAIIKQLKKALACKDDKELRLRVEVIVDLMEETKPVFIPQSQPQPQPMFPKREPTLDTPNISGQKGNKVKGAGAISPINSEQINYTRPAGL